MHLLGMLREISAARAEILDAPVHLHASTDGIAVRFHAAQPQRDRVSLAAASILQDSNLGREATLQDNIEIAVAIDIGNCERARIIGEVETADA